MIRLISDFYAGKPNLLTVMEYSFSSFWEVFGTDFGRCEIPKENENNDYSSLFEKIKGLCIKREKVSFSCQYEYFVNSLLTVEQHTSL